MKEKRNKAKFSVAAFCEYHQDLSIPKIPMNRKDRLNRQNLKKPSKTLS